MDKNFVIKNVEVDYRDRPEGSDSKLNSISDGIREIKTIFQFTAGFLMLAALLNLSCGFILDTENKKARQNFELQLNVLAQLIKLEKK